MKNTLLLAIVMLVLVLVALIYLNRLNRNIIRETFGTSINLDKISDNTEKVIKFCRELRKLDKPNEKNILLKKIKNETIDRNEETISDLLKEIDELQMNIIKNDTSVKNKYRYYTHNQAKKQLDVINKAKSNVENANKLKVMLR